MPKAPRVFFGVEWVINKITNIIDITPEIPEVSCAEV